jgi:kumamolisin
LKGEGQIVDIAACFGFNTSSLMTYQTTFGLSPAPNATAVTSQHGSSVEANLAVQRVYGTAPAAKIRMWFQNGCSLSGFVTEFFEIASDQRKFPAAALTIAFGLPELIIGARYSSLFTMADTALSTITGGAAQKVALFAASGDNGDLSIWDHFEVGTPLGQTDVVFPASDPHVLSVGGTNLVLSPTFTRGEETAWGGSQINASSLEGGDGGISPSGGGSGGGISNKFGTPPWQKKIPGTFSQRFKNLPDVSFNASLNSPTLFVSGSSVLPIGGTSAAAPTWAATVALLQQNYEQTHHGAKLSNWPAFFYNPTQRAGMFTDITEGTNGFFRAGPGYDNVTGLGVPCFLHFPNPCVHGR